MASRRLSEFCGRPQQLGPCGRRKKAKHLHRHGPRFVRARRNRSHDHGKEGVNAPTFEKAKDGPKVQDKGVRNRDSEYRANSLDPVVGGVAARLKRPHQHEVVVAGRTRAAAARAYPLL